MPFYVPWSTAPSDVLPTRFAQYHWTQRAELAPARWALDLAVLYEGELVGCQGLSTKNFLATRTGETGSWLGRTHQGRGIGTAMRQVVCAFAFDHLDATEVTSGAFTDNPASLGVSRKVGYHDNGRDRVERREGELAVVQKLALTPEEIVRFEHPLEVDGVDAFRRSIGLVAA